MKIKISELEKLIVKIFRKKYSLKESEKIKETIMFAELSGKKSHWIIRIPELIKDDKIWKPFIQKKTWFASIVNWNNNCGMLVWNIAMEESIKLASKKWFWIVGIKNIFSTTGSLGYYIYNLAKKWYVSIVLGQSPVTMSWFGSILPIFGTNPIAFWFPGVEEPLIFDMATSAISRWEILKCEAENKKLPINSAIDEKWYLTIDPKKAKDWATLPFDNGYKWSWLAMVVEILWSVFTGAWFLWLHEDDGWWTLFISIDSNIFLENNNFESRLKEFVDYLHTFKTLDWENLRLSWENSIKQYKELLDIWEIEISRKSFDDINRFIKKNIKKWNIY